jgi:hypothetical protein
MGAAVVLTVSDGFNLLEEYVFRGPMVWTVGRATDCQLVLPSDPVHSTVSRYHCRLDVAPPLVRVRDLGSRNGTYVNGRNIGQREGPLVGESHLVSDMPDVEVHPGDEIRVGGVTMSITVGADDDDAAAPPAPGPT